MTSSPWVVVLLLAGFACLPLLLKRTRSTGPDAVRVVARTALHRNAVVAVLAIGDRKVLVGAGDRGVQLLADLDDADGAPQEAHDTPSSGTSAGRDLSVSDRTDAVLTTTSSTSDMAAALAALHAEVDASSTAGPGTGLVDRLRAMTVRATPPPRARGQVEVGRPGRVQLLRR